MNRKIIISGGGTGGHIFPALSIANALKRLDPNIEILFVGALGKMEMEKVPQAGYPIVGLPVQGMVRSSIIKNIKVVYNLLKSLQMASKIINDFKPDAIVGVGGYASGPLCIRGALKNIPVILQEQNSYAGVTNKLLGRYASRICVAYDNMERFFSADKIKKTGNPVRSTLLESLNETAEAYRFYQLDPTKKTILVTGGSLGARTMNKAVEKLIERVATANDVQMIWQCGKFYFDMLKERYYNLYDNIKLMPFIERMDYAYAISDIVVARAGASTISELALLGKASILIPSPNVAEDHQTHNAMALVNREAALFVHDAKAEEELEKKLFAILSNDTERETLARNIKKMAYIRADEVIAREVLSLIDRDKKA